MADKTSKTNRPETRTGVPPRQQARSRQAPDPARPAPRRPAQRQRSRRRRRLGLLIGVAAVAAAALAVGLVLATGGSSGSPGSVGPEGVVLEKGPVLAPAGAAPVADSSRFGVGCGATEQTTEHIHSHLAVYVSGRLRPVPAAVGMAGQVQMESSPKGSFAAGSSQCLYWLHTHAADGIIHIEAPAARDFVLGQFFSVWNQPLSNTQVGPAKGNVVAFVNGQRWNGPVSEIPLASHEAIQLDVGTPVVPFKPVSFPSSL